MALFQLVAVLLAVLSLGAREGNGYSSGAPSFACSTITPNHGGSSGTIPGGFFLYSDLIDSGGDYTAGTSYTIRLEGSEQFRGFLIQARTMGTTTPIGSFDTPSGTQHRSCSGVAAATVTHTGSGLKSSVTFQWTAPSNTGTVRFQYAVVISRFNYFANIDSSAYRPPAQSTTPMVPSSTLASLPPSSTPVPQLVPSSTLIMPAAPVTSSVVAANPTSTVPTTPMPTPPPSLPVYMCPTTDKTASSSFSLTFAQPAGCSRQSCDVYVAMAPNPMNSSYLDIYMEGTAAGWVAVGFSDSRAMENTDVIGCRVGPGSTVSVVDTWNPSPNYSPNELDDTQDGVCTHSTSFNGGRISCLLSRYGAAIDAGRDLDWNTNHYIIFGRRDMMNSVQNLMAHTEIPMRTTELLNAFTENNHTTSTMPSTTPSPTPPTSFTCPATDKNGQMPFSNLTFGTPAGCSRTSCEVYVTMAPNTMNPDYLDIYMEGTAAGWIAVGFSDSRAMENTDVIGCRVGPGSTVSVVDTWNPSPNYSPNQLDSTQDGVCTHTASFSNGRISCLLSRYGAAIDAGRDLDWKTDRYIILGRRDMTNTAQNLMPHTEIPMRTTALFNAFTDGDDTPTPTSPPSTSDCPMIDKDGDMPFSNLTFGIPPGCLRTSCNVYVTMAPNTMNSSYLDIYMEGTAAGWVAVGFSESRAMENTDVLGCRVDSGSMVRVVDTWNPSPNRSPNELDQTQDGVCPHSASFTNGRIRCLFSRYSSVINTGRDLDLNSSLYIMYGRRIDDNAGDMSLLRHTLTPARTDERVNPLNASGEAPVVSNYPHKALLKVHGILMLISWPILATIAIFFASWMKPALPNGEWFQTHRALLVISLFVTVAGFIFAFVALATNPTPGLISFDTTSQRVHFSFGLIVVLFQIINPIIAIFRCKPKSSNRWIFNLVHASIVGVIAEILALTNVGIGLSLFAERYSLPLTAFWIFVAYIVLAVILEVVMHVVFIIIAFMAPPEDREKLMPTTLQWCFSSSSEKYDTSEIELKEKGEKEKEKEAELQNEKKERKPASNDAPFRWVGVGALFFISLLVLVMIVMVAIA